MRLDTSRLVYYRYVTYGALPVLEMSCLRLLLWHTGHRRLRAAAATTAAAGPRGMGWRWGWLGTAREPRLTKPPPPRAPEVAAPPRPSHLIRWWWGAAYS
jgi:hypothetical protein